MFGKIDETGLATLDKIAAAGVDGGGGRPAGDPVTGEVHRARLSRTRTRPPATLWRVSAAYARTASPPRPTNGMAIASLICAFLFAPLGIIFGHISLSQIKRTGEDGRGLALAGLVVATSSPCTIVVWPPSCGPIIVAPAPQTRIPLCPGFTAAPRHRRRAAGFRSAAHGHQLPVPDHPRAGE